MDLRLRLTLGAICVASMMYYLHRNRFKHFKSATTGIATKNMRNELNALVNSVKDPQAKKVRTDQRSCSAA